MTQAVTEDRRAQANAARDVLRAAGVVSGRVTLDGPRKVAPRVSLSVRLGPMVRFEVEGETCTDIADALSGFERLNQVVDAMFSDLAGRVYPGGAAADGEDSS